MGKTMQNKGALVYAYVLDGKGSGKAVEFDDINKWEPGHGLLWLHLDSTIPEARSWLENYSGISDITRESMLEKETRPRNIQTTDGLLLILRGVNCNPGAGPEDMVAIRILLSEQRIISTRYRRIKAVQDVNEAIIGGNGPSNE